MSFALKSLTECKIYVQQKINTERYTQLTHTWCEKERKKEKENKEESKHAQKKIDKSAQRQRPPFG